MPKYKTVIFVNGCFWHAHEGCRYFVWPKSNVDFWEIEINGNIQRDLRNNQLLAEQGWNVIVIWECQLKNATFNETAQKLIDQIKELD